MRNLGMGERRAGRTGRLLIYRKLSITCPLLLWRLFRNTRLVCHSPASWDHICYRLPAQSIMEKAEGISRSAPAPASHKRQLSLAESVKWNRGRGTSVIVYGRYASEGPGPEAKDAGGRLCGTRYETWPSASSRAAARAGATGQELQCSGRRAE